MTLLQMTGMYQTIANDGVRIPPRIVKTTIAPDGTRTDEPRPEGVRVVSPRDRADGAADAAGDAAARSAGRYSRAPGRAARSRAIRSRARPAPRSRSTPAAGATTTTSTGSRSPGSRPTDDPRYVVGVMMDNPHRTADGSPGTTAAPLFHNIAVLAVAARERTALTRPGSAADASGHLSEPGTRRAGRYCVIRHEPASQPSCRPRARAAGRAGGCGARRRRRPARHTDHRRDAAQPGCAGRGSVRRAARRVVARRHATPQRRWREGRPRSSPTPPARPRSAAMSMSPS